MAPHGIRAWKLQTQKAWREDAKQRRRDERAATAAWLAQMTPEQRDEVQRQMWVDRRRKAEAERKFASGKKTHCTADYGALASDHPKTGGQDGEPASLKRGPEFTSLDGPQASRARRKP